MQAAPRAGYLSQNFTPEGGLGPSSFYNRAVVKHAQKGMFDDKVLERYSQVLSTEVGYPSRFYTEDCKRISYDLVALTAIDSNPSNKEFIATAIVNVEKSLNPNGISITSFFIEECRKNIDAQMSN